MVKQLFVSSAIQAALLKQVIIPQMKDGFWKSHRPADHATQWLDVEIVVSTDSRLGPVNFKVPRLYNFVNPDFINPNQNILVSVAQSVKSSCTFRSVKKELIELSRIVGGRLSDKSSAPTKANRGNNKAPVTSDIIQKARAAIASANNTVKRTAVKRPETVEIIKTSQGATVRRVAVTRV